MLGKKAMEAEILPEEMEIAREKNCSRALCYLGTTVPDERVAETVTVSCSRLAERLKEPAQGHPTRYSKAEIEMVRVVFILDCCDCGARGAIATTAGISGQMVQDLMLECVEKRFGALKTPHPVEWFSDNGSCYTDKEMVAFASLLGPLSRFTPVHSPKSNSMAEAFVNTIKRDCGGVHARPDAATVLAQLPG